MRLALVTINFGDVLCENARRSLQAAARRWGASYVEMTPESTSSSITWDQCKLRVFQYVDADRVLCIDADAVIRGDAPSPFEVCPPDMLGAVKNSLPRMPDYAALLKVEAEDWARINGHFGRSLPRDDKFFNAGVMVLSRSAHEEFLKRAEFIQERVGKDLTWFEQSAMNYAAAELGIPLYLMDETWNYVHPEQLGHWDYMERYVYHFAGKPDRDRILSRIRWRMPLSHLLARRLAGRPRARRFLAWCETRLRPPPGDGSWRGPGVPLPRCGASPSWVRSSGTSTGGPRFPSG